MQRYLLDFAQEELLGESSGLQTGAQRAPARREGHGSRPGTHRCCAQEKPAAVHAARNPPALPQRRLRAPQSCAPGSRLQMTPLVCADQPPPRGARRSPAPRGKRRGEVAAMLVASPSPWWWGVCVGSCFKIPMVVWGNASQRTFSGALAPTRWLPYLSLPSCLL